MLLTVHKLLFRRSLTNDRPCLDSTHTVPSAGGCPDSTCPTAIIESINDVDSDEYQQLQLAEVIQDANVAFVPIEKDNFSSIQRQH